jgi:hypothetical protein
MLNIDQVNALCAELASEAAEANMDALIADLEQEEFEAHMLALGPRAFGPDAGADDSSGLFYWDLK